MSIFNDLYIFEMANNHQGSVEHGKNIIQKMSEISKKYSIKGAVKFQFRDLDTFVHDDFKDRDDVKHIPRFMGTRLNDNEFSELVEEVRKNDLLTISTPFDEISVDRCVQEKLDIVKVASCSANDWPLLSKIADSKLPVIASTGGLSIYEIDKVVSFLTHRNVNFALLHCIASYPTPNEDIQMGFMSKMIKRYPEIPIGYSGHEAPSNFDVVKGAVAKGAQILERHVGVETDEIQLNKYSMNPEETSKWVAASQLMMQICEGNDDKRISKEEIDSLQSLKRGVYTRHPLKSGDIITSDDVYFAMPCQDGQTTSGELGKYRANIAATKNYNLDEGIFEKVSEKDPVEIIRSILHDVKGMIFEAGIRFGKEYEIELSHHYGIEKFREYGAVIVNLINREYCKKLIILLPGQKHPTHHHRVKEETFQVLSGKLYVNMEGKEYNLSAGDILLVERRMDHSFSSKNGVIFEEISTTHVKGDSYYQDDKIAILDPMQRKTLIEEF